MRNAERLILNAKAPPEVLYVERSALSVKKIREKRTIQVSLS
jgi:hypothetical protein